MNTTVFRALLDHYENTDALLGTEIDYAAKTLLMAFETHETLSLILPRDALSLNSLEAVVQEDDDLDADFRPISYNSILFYLMTSWQECSLCRRIPHHGFDNLSGNPIFHYRPGLRHPKQLPSRTRYPRRQNTFKCPIMKL